MAKKEIKYCKKCQRYTRHICVGKEKVKLSGEEIWQSSGKRMCSNHDVGQV